MKRTFVYQAYVAPKKPKVVKTAAPIKTTKVAKAKPRPKPVDTSEYTARINSAVKKFTLYHNAESVLLLDKLAQLFMRLDHAVQSGNVSTTKRNIGDLLAMLTRVPHNKNQLKLAPTGSDTYSHAILNIAQRTIKESAEEWLKPEEFEMVSMYFSDAADYLHIANYVRLGHRLRANYILQGMDTSAREKISERAYNWIVDHSDSRLYT